MSEINNLVEYKKALLNLNDQDIEIDDRIKKTEKKIDYCIEILHRTPKLLEELDQQFEEKTGLNSLDISILFLASGLQIIRQFYFSSSMKRVSDSEAAKNTKGHYKESSDRAHRLYNPTLDQVICNPVPFDVIDGSTGQLGGSGKFGHRGKTLGHDPLLGLIFGTANIATSTVTLTDFSSYHVKTGNRGDRFYQHASTNRIFKEMAKKMKDKEGLIIVAESLRKEIVHLKSDLNTANSLPIPIVNTINPIYASNLSKMGLDCFNIVKIGRYVASAEMTFLINRMISILHGLFFTGHCEMDMKLYQVKTKKIVNYSNIISSMTNILKTYITQDLSQLDIGGISAAVYTVITNKKYIQDVKNEFIFGSYKSIFLNESFLDDDL